MEDTGKLIQIGHSAGSRSQPAFYWVRNITSKHANAPKFDRKAADLFVFVWQHMQSILPTEVLDDFKLFIKFNDLPRMNPEDPHTMLPPLKKGNVKNTHPTGKYSVTIQGKDFEFQKVEFAPPGGVCGKNYSWWVTSNNHSTLFLYWTFCSALHHKHHPHKYAISWTILCTPGFHDGCHFFLAHYGVHIQQVANTLIVWVPDNAHGTSLLMAGPYNKEPEFYQRGLAFVFSPRIATAWAPIAVPFKHQTTLISIEMSCIQPMS